MAGLVEKFKKNFNDIAYLLTKNKNRFFNLWLGLVVMEDLTTWHLLHRAIYSSIDVLTMTHVFGEMILFYLFVYMLKQAGESSELYQQDGAQYQNIQSNKEYSEIKRNTQIHEEYVFEKEMNKD